MSTSQMMARLRPFGISFDKSLEDLIKGIRANSDNPEKLAHFLDGSIQECKDELKKGDNDQKAKALLKLAYLEMYGYDMGWCCFHILEVLSSPKFQDKRIGYLAAIQIMQRQNNHDALMLMTNQLKKDLNSSNTVECGLAISCVASIVDSELAQDIADDIVRMLHHSKPYIRKRAVLCLYKIFLKYPEALRAYFQQLVDMLDDSDTSVVSATVNVICELAHANPKNYVDLAPRLYGLMKDTSNNWMVIRLLKLFSSLSLCEPRLKTKLLPEIISLMERTDALSLVYECINAILNGDMLEETNVSDAELIIHQLLYFFFKSDDQNLKYVGLLAFIKTCRVHKQLIKKHDKILLQCLYDDDITIRETSLEIVNYLVSEKNIVTIVTRLLVQLIPYTEQRSQLQALNKETEEFEADNDDDNDGDNDVDDQSVPAFLSRHPQQALVVSEKYKLRVIEKIIEICTMDNYAYIPNFHWFLGVLKDIIKLNSDIRIASVDRLAAEQFLDMGIRVPSIRPYLVETCINLCLQDETKLLNFRLGLKDCVWLVAEYYIDYLNGDDEEEDEDEEDENGGDGDDDEVDPDTVKRNVPKKTVPFIVDQITGQRLLIKLAGDEEDATVAVYIQALAKLFSRFCEAIGSYWQEADFDTAIGIADTIVEWLDNFRTCTNFGIQERAVQFTEVLKLVLDALNTAKAELEPDMSLEPPKLLTLGYAQLFDIAPIKPISKTLQRKIPVPDDLALDIAIDGEAMSRFADSLAKIQAADAQFQEESEEDLLDVESYKDRSDTSSEEDEEAGSDDEAEEKRRNERKERLKDDPFYIQDSSEKVRSTSESGEGGKGSAAISSGPEVKPKQKKKSNKPKKIRREKVLVLDEEGDNGAPPSPAKHERPRKSSSKFMVDSSNLDKIDLKQDPSELDAVENDGAYDVEKEVANIRAAAEQSLSVDTVDTVDTSAGKSVSAAASAAAPVAVKRKKPKKKAKKKAAVIQ